jgi:hypothetical protein
MLRAAKVEIKVISEILGHASTSFTDDVYTVVAEETRGAGCAGDLRLRAAPHPPERLMTVGTINGPSGGKMIFNAIPGGPHHERGLPGQGRRLGDLNPGWAVDPNRISSAAP